MTRIAIWTAALTAIGAIAASCGGKSPSQPTTTATGATAPAAPEAPAADPQTPPELVFPDEPFRAQQPPAGEPRAFQLPGIHQFELANGIEVFLVERHELPTISMELAFEGGAINDPKNKPGLASICMAMLSEGTKELEKLAFEAALADTASRVSSYAGTEQQGVSMATLSKHFEPTLELWIDTLREPGMRQAEFDRLVKRSIESVKQSKGSTTSIATRVADALVYGKQHPYGQITTEDSLGKLRLADCKRYHRQYVKPKGAKLFVVGDITEQQIRDAVGKRLARWRGAPKKSARIPAAKPMKGRVFFVNVPRAQQSYVALAHVGPARNADDYFATSLLGKIFGGGFSSRLNMNLREDKGYAYGARGGFAYNRTGSRVSAGARVQSDKTRESIVEVYKELVALHTGEVPVTTAEVTREKQGEILSLPAAFATSRGVLSRYQTLVYYHLPMDYYDNYVENVQSVTEAQVMAAAKQHFKPGDAKILVVGDAEQALPGLYELVAEQTFGEGDLVVLDADANVLERVAPAQAKDKR